MDRDALCRLSAVRLAALIRQREVSPVEVVDAVLDRIDRVDPILKAFMTLVPERARTAAREAEAAVQRGDAHGPLHGVPLTIKDAIWVSGIRSTLGIEPLARFVPDRSAICVDRLVQAGAIVLGTTNVPELSSTGFTTNRLIGTTRNPWDTDRTPGGSTGGGAAAVAAGLGPVTIGTDTGGSIRRPACHVGIVGYKPTQGRIPLGPGHPSSTGDYTVAGPLTRTVEDAALMLSVMAGRHPYDRQSFLPDLPDAATLAQPAALRGVRVAWTPDLGDRPVDPDVRALCERAARAFEDLGCVVERATPAIPQDFEDVVTRALGAPGTAELLAPFLPEQADTLGPEALASVEAGSQVTGREMVRARQYQTAVYQELLAFFGRYDLLLTPTAASLPWTVDRPYPGEIEGQAVGPRGHAAFTPFGNHCGLPAISVPAGWTGSGLPVGLQIVGPFAADAFVLQTAAAYEQARPWADRWPAEPAPPTIAG
ncbi:MAG: amidase [Chloroflexi bacterium]|nr:amidase [Chloroflexota bacterium]